MNAQDVLGFWFGEELKPRKEWFTKNSAFDEEIRSRFLSLHEQAISGQLHAWTQTPEAALALVIVPDQFSRNLFAVSPKRLQAIPRLWRWHRGRSPEASTNSCRYSNESSFICR